MNDSPNAAFWKVAVTASGLSGHDIDLGSNRHVHTISCLMRTGTD